MSSELVDNIEKLINAGYGDYGRLTAILEAVRKGKILYSSDQQYVDNLISKHLPTPTEHVVEQKNENTESDPLYILNKRLASGEIKEKKYDKLRKKLEKEEKKNRRDKTISKIQHNNSDNYDNKKMSAKKKVGITSGIVFVIFVIIVAIASTTNPSDQGKNVLQNNSPEITNLITKPLDGIFPSRQDVGTEWEIGSSYGGDNQFNSGVYQYRTGLGMVVSLDNWQDEQRIKDSAGFQSSLQKAYTKHRDSGGITKVWVNEYKFDTIDNSNKYYQDFITYLTNKGGFKEYQTTDIGAKCYSTDKEEELSSTISIYCVKSNLNYHVIGSSDQALFYDDKLEINKFAQIVATNTS